MRIFEYKISKNIYVKAEITKLNCRDECTVLWNKRYMTDSEKDR